MTWLTFLLAWFSISIFTLGAYMITTYAIRKKKENLHNCNSLKGCGTYAPPEIFTPTMTDLMVTPESIDAYLISRLSPDNVETLLTHNCLECGEGIAPDERPYCTRCFERLEMEGFFEE